MKLGFFIMPVHPLTRNYAETLREDREAFILADKLGYSEGYCGEHLTDLAENIPSSLTFIGSLAGYTSQIRLGTAVANLPFSHPLLLATQAALVDNLLEGRLMFGIGAGVLRTDMEAMELLDADRGAMFAEAIDHIVALWTGEAPYNLTGKYWNISTAKTRWPEIGLGGVVKPFQKPHPPILGTATDPYSKGLIALGRRGWWPISSHFLHPNWLLSQWKQYAKGCVEGGHRADRANWRVARSIFVADDDKTARAYGGDDARSPYRFYMNQLTAKLKKGNKLGGFKESDGHARRRPDARLHFRQRRHSRQRQPRRRLAVWRCTRRSAISARCSIAARTGSTRAVAALDGTDGREGHAGGQRGDRQARRRRNSGRARPSLYCGCTNLEPSCRSRSSFRSRITSAKTRRRAA